MYKSLNNVSKKSAVNIVYYVLSLMNKGQNPDNYKIIRSDIVDDINDEDKKNAEQLISEINLNRLDASERRAVADNLYNYILNIIRTSSDNSRGKDMLDKFKS